MASDRPGASAAMDEDTLLAMAWHIVGRLEERGWRAYLVGGCVRDRLLGRPLKDVDIATSARPEDVMALFERTEPTGLAHGTVTVILKGKPFEVTTFRTESGYSDGRRPDAVRFIDDIEQDLARRDFTVNAMALAKDGRLVDPFGGRRDLENRILRAVGDPRLRFEEDALRMLRAIRFAAEYGLSIEPATWRAIVAMAPRIGLIATERVRMELERITEGRDPARGYLLLKESGLAGHFRTPLPLERLPDDTRAALGRLTETGDGTVRWIRLFAALGCESGEAAGLMRRLTFSNRRTEDISTALAFGAGAGSLAGRTDDGASRAFKRLVLRHGPQAARRWLDAAALAPDADGAFLDAARRWLTDMPARELKELAAGGRDLIAAGLAPGPAVGRLLERLLERVALGELANRRELLIGEALKMARDGLAQDGPAGREEGEGR